MIKKVLIITVVIAGILPAAASAQLQWGGGVEFREDGPDAGINLRVEYPFKLQKYEQFIFSAGFIGNFFPTDRLETRPGGLDDELVLLGQSYQFGGYFQGEFEAPVGPLNPYSSAGFGFESNNIKINEPGRSPLDEPHELQGVSETKSFPYLELAVGAKLMIFPRIKPFAEFRYHESLGEVKDLNGNLENFNIEGNNRFIFGFIFQLR